MASARKVPPPGRCWVAPDAVLIGRVRLEDEASVWWRSVLRGDNELIQVGARSNVQDGAMLHTDMGFPLTIGADCTIGHHAILHGCTIGDGVAGRHGRDAAQRRGHRPRLRSSAPMRSSPRARRFPISLIVGAPARAVRALDPEAVARLATSAAGYVANWKRYAAA